MHSPKFPEYNDAEIREWIGILYKDGKSLRWIADKLEISHSSVRRALVNEKVSRRSKEEITIGERRTCRVCHRDKPLKQFHKDSTKSRGYGYVCKRCRQSKTTNAG